MKRVKQCAVMVFLAVLSLSARAHPHSFITITNQLVLTFTLPLAKPQPLAGQTYIFSTFDPTYYVDMSYEKDGDVAFAPDYKGACKVSVHTPKPNEDMLLYAQSLDKEDAPAEDMELGKQFAQKVTIQCP